MPGKRHTAPVSAPESDKENAAHRERRWRVRDATNAQDGAGAAKWIRESREDDRLCRDRNGQTRRKVCLRCNWRRILLLRDRATRLHRATRRTQGVLSGVHFAGGARCEQRLSNRCHDNQECDQRDPHDFSITAFSRPSSPICESLTRQLRFAAHKLLDPQPSETLRRRRAFPMTDTELKLMAAPAMIGLRRIPNQGYKIPAAIGIPRLL